MDACIPLKIERQLRDAVGKVALEKLNVRLQYKLVSDPSHVKPAPGTGRHKVVVGYVPQPDPPQISVADIPATCNMITESWINNRVEWSGLEAGIADAVETLYYHECGYRAHHNTLSDVWWALNYDSLMFAACVVVGISGKHISRTTMYAAHHILSRREDVSISRLLNGHVDFITKLRSITTPIPPGPNVAV